MTHPVPFRTNPVICRKNSVLVRTSPVIFMEMQLYETQIQSHLGKPAYVTKAKDILNLKGYQKLKNYGDFVKWVYFAFY